MKKLNYDFLDCVKQMPPLNHSKPQAGFNILESEVVKWIIMQPDVMQKLFNMAINKKVIRYNSEICKWQGVQYGED